MIDLISREMALDVLVTSPNFHTTLTRIEELPAVDAIPVEWLDQRRFEASYNGAEPNIELNHAFCTVMNEWQDEQEAKT